MHYCIGDVHGCYDDMMAIINKINKADPDARFIFLGDFPDRGPKVWETLEWARKNVTPEGKYQSVQGNHEQMILQWYLQFCEWYQKPLHFTSEPPRTNYDFIDVAREQKLLKPQLLDDLMSFFTSLPFHKVITVEGRNGEPVTYDIVHAWYDFRLPEHSQEQYMTNIWERSLNGNHQNDHIIIHGHTPTASGLYALSPHSAPGMIVYRENAINIDGGCVFGPMMPECPCLLCGICLETLEEFYSADLDERIQDPAMQRYYRRTFLSRKNPYRRDILSRLGRNADEA